MKEGLELCLTHNQCSTNISSDSEICYYNHYDLGTATQTQFCSLFGLITFSVDKAYGFLPMKLFFFFFFFPGGILQRYKMTSQKGLQLLER